MIIDNNLLLNTYSLKSFIYSFKEILLTYIMRNIVNTETELILLYFLYFIILFPIELRI